MFLPAKVSKAFQWQIFECEDGGFLFPFSSGFPLLLYTLLNFRHFYARKGGTLKWRHRVVAYGCGYLEITVSVYALRSPRLSSYLPITHSSCNPFVFGVSHHFCFVSRTSCFKHDCFYVPKCRALSENENIAIQY